MLAMAKKTMRIMMKDRGEDDCLEIVDRMTRFCVAEERYRTTTVFYIQNSKLKVNMLRFLLKKCEDKKIIIVCELSLTPFAKKEIAQSSRKIQFFTYKELFSPVGRHPQVPRHRLVGRENYKKGMPILRSDDPISKYAWFEDGDIVSIERTTDTGKKYLYFREVLLLK